MPIGSMTAEGVLGGCKIPGVARNASPETFLTSICGIRGIRYWLMATPLKDATPMGLEVATWVRSPYRSMEKIVT